MPEEKKQNYLRREYFRKYNTTRISFRLEPEEYEKLLKMAKFDTVHAYVKKNIRNHIKSFFLKGGIING